MKVKGATLGQICAAVDKAGHMHTSFKKRDTHTLVKLLPADDEYRSISPHTGRRLNAVCYHGHYAWLEELFKLAPEAIVETSWYGNIRYTAEDWRDKAEAHGDKMVGSLMYPYALREKCNCEV